MRRLSLRSHYWGALVVVVAAGDLNADGAERLSSYLDQIVRGHDVIVDLWDVSRCDPEAVASLEDAKARAEAAGWGLVVVADPKGHCADALDGGYARPIETYADRHAARGALYQ